MTTKDAYILAGFPLRATGFVLVLATCGLFSDEVRAQEPRFRTYSVEEGLSQSAVYDMMQDGDGFLWLATQDGLSRFDGYGFDIFSHDPADSTSISANWIASLFEDSSSRIWAGTHGGGLNLFDNELGTFRSYRHDPAESSSLPHDMITDIVEDGSGSIWISTYGGLARLRKEDGAFDVFREDPERGAWLQKDRVLALAVDASGRLWAGTDLGGIHIYNEAANSFEVVEIPNQEAEPTRRIILNLYPDVDGSMWVGTGGSGVFKVNSDGGVAGPWLPESNDSELARRILSMRRDEEGRLRVGTDGAGVGVINPESATYRLYGNRASDERSLPNNTVNTLMTDAAGYFWVGTTGGGVAREFALDQISSRTEPGITSSHVMALYESDSGSIWVGTDVGGVEQIAKDGRVTRFEYPQLGNNRIHDIHGSRDDGIWIATAGGLNQLDFLTHRIRTWVPEPGNEATLFDARVMALEESTLSDHLWVATWGGLHKMDTDGTDIEQIRNDPEDDNSISNNRTISVFEDSRGRLWVGTFGGGLNKMDPGIDGFTRYAYREEEPSSISGNIVADIFESSDSTIWIGTEAGLNRFDERTGSFTRITEKDGLPNNTVYGILEDVDGRLWMSTNNGLAVLTPDTGSIRTFSHEDGLQSNEFNQGAFYRAPDGAMLFGGINGFNRFYPDRLLSSRGAAPALTALSTSQQSWPSTALASLKEIELRPGYGALNVEFTTLDWRDPEGSSFEVMLDGVDDVWQQRSSSQRFASWSRLPGGRFDLRIRTIGADGQVAAIERSISVRVVPPVTARAWFRGLMAFLVLGAFAGIGYAWHLSRLRLLHRKQREQQEVHRRLMEGRENERLHMARDLHDGAVQDLYGIRYKIQATNSAPNESFGDGQSVSSSEDADLMVQGVITQLRQICGELRPPVLAPFGLEKAIRAHADTFSEKDGAPELKLNLDSDGQSIPEDVRLALFRVYQESMNNILKHARANFVTVRLSLEAPAVELCIDDDGKGFTLPDSWIELGRKNHFGLMGLSERVTALGARLDVQTAPGEGTRIRVVVEDVSKAAMSIE